MELSVHDIIGFIGVGFVVGAYFLSQIGRMDANRPLYPALNGLGAGLILISLFHSFNAASFVIESIWLAVSAIGLGRSLYLRLRGRGR